MTDNQKMLAFHKAQVNPKAVAFYQERVDAERVWQAKAGGTRGSKHEREKRKRKLHVIGKRVL